jgi:hypothetical protein
VEGREAKCTQSRSRRFTLQRYSTVEMDARCYSSGSQALSGMSIISRPCSIGGQFPLSQPLTLFTQESIHGLPALSAPTQRRDKFLLHLHRQGTCQVAGRVASTPADESRAPTTSAQEKTKAPQRAMQALGIVVRHRESSHHRSDAHQPSRLCIFKSMHLARSLSVRSGARRASGNF